MAVSIKDIDTGFSEIPSLNSGKRTYWVTKPTEQEVPQDTTIRDEFEQEKKIKILTPEEAKKTNNPVLIGLSIAGAVILTAGGVFFFLGGGQKGLTKKLYALRNYFEQQIQKTKLDNPNNPKYNWLYAGFVKLIDQSVKRFGIINNFNTFKDLIFKKVMFNKATGKVTGPIHSGITRFFEWISKQAVKSKYKSSSKSALATKDLVTEMLKKVSTGNMSDIIEVNGVQATRKQWIAQIKRLMAELEKGYNSHFGQKAVDTRYTQIDELAKNLIKYFDEKGTFWFWSKDTVNKFVADSAITKDKLKLQKQVRALKRSLYYSRKDLAQEASDSILNITRLIPINDTNKMRILGNIRQNIKEFFRHGKSQTVYDALEVRILKDIETFIEQTKKMSKGNSRSELLKEAEELKELLSGYKRGKAQNVLDIFRKLLSKDEYDELYHSFRVSAKKLDKSIKGETEEFVDKVRDLATGSAPTDILTILSAFGTLGYYLAKSDSKEQKESVALKYGIPAIAGIFTSLICNAKMYAGSKSLIFGGISTLVVGKLGSLADNALKEKQEQERLLIAQKTKETELKNNSQIKSA